MYSVNNIYIRKGKQNTFEEGGWAVLVKSVLMII